MRRKLLNVDQLQAVQGCQTLDRDQREVGEVLVIDRVELVLRHQSLEMRELQGDDAFRLEQAGHARDEVVEVGHLSQHVVADDQIRAFAFGDQRVRQLDAEESDARRNTVVDRRPWQRWRPARCRARARPAAKSAAADSHRCSRVRPPGCPGRARAAPRSSRNTPWRGRPKSSNRRRSRRILEKSTPGSHTPSAEPGSKCRRRARGAGSKAPSRRPARAQQSSRTAATSRDRRMCVPARGRTVDIGRQRERAGHREPECS